MGRSIEVTLADGQQTDVHLDKNFTVLSSATDSDSGDQDWSGNQG
ncbi:hypothetical protein [Streptomyces sp. SLBN-118]|nr:hypothetical protein [Streptomyces sp. SLBN-118]